MEIRMIETNYISSYTRKATLPNMKIINNR